MYLLGESEDEGASLLSAVPTDRTKGDGHKLKYLKYPLNKRKHSSTVRMVKLWNRLLRNVV